jgi:multidrug efflux pump subunit AcrA (membrane-fusion protein)
VTALALTAQLPLLVAGLAGCAKKPPPPPPPTVVVSRPLQRKIVDWDDYVGRFVAENSVDVRPRVSGYLQSIGFRDGQTVRKGQVLFVIDPRPYQDALDQARGQAAHAASALANARIELARAAKLLADKAISEELYETRLATEQQAAADLVTAQASVASAALNLGFTRVTAPVTGRASDHRISPGNLVVQDQPNYVIHGHMDFVDNAEDTNSGTIRARAVVPNPTLKLTPGMFGSMRLLGSGSYDALLIPDDAVSSQQADQIVYVVRGGVVQQRKVVTGPLVDGLRVVRQGIQPDDEVIFEGVTRARTGQKVTARAGQIVPPSPGASPSPADLAPPPSSATFAATTP